MLFGERSKLPVFSRVYSGSIKNISILTEMVTIIEQLQFKQIHYVMAGVNGSNNNGVVCSNGVATIHFARENKRHAVIKETPVETFGRILIHGHETGLC